MVSHGLSQSKADLLVLDITERFVTAGFGWDKVLQYHGKVCNQKLANIPWSDPTLLRARMFSSRSSFLTYSCQRTNSLQASPPRWFFTRLLSLWKSGKVGCMTCYPSTRPRWLLPNRLQPRLISFTSSFSVFLLHGRDIHCLKGCKIVPVIRSQCLL